MINSQIKKVVSDLNLKNVHVHTHDGRFFTGYLNLAGDFLILTLEEYVLNIDEVSSIREV